MRPNKRIRLFGRVSYWVLIVLLGLVGISSTAWLMFPQPAEEEEQFDRADRFDRFYAKGVNLRSFDPTGEIAYSFRAEEILHKKERIGFLTLRAVKRLELHKVLLEYRDYGEAGSPAAPVAEGSGGSPVGAGLPVIETLTNSLSVIPKDLGLIRKTIIHGFDVRGRNETGVFLTIQSSNAHLDPDRSVMVLQGRVMLRAHQDQLFAKSVDWWPREGRFAVKGPYFLKTKGAKPSAGRGGTLMLTPSGLERVDR